MGLKECSYCGLPYVVTLASIWHDDGTITTRFIRGTRAALVYVCELDYILSGISERIGFDISHIVLEGERKARYKLYRNMLDSWHGLVGVVARNRLLEKLVVKISDSVSTDAGYGKCINVQVVRGQRLVIEVENPYIIPIMAGDSLASFEAYFGQQGAVTWEGDSQSVVFTVTAGAEKSRIEEDRLEPVLPVTLSGHVQLNRCPRCRVPLELSKNNSLDLEKGIATENSTGRRVVNVLVDSLNAIFMELEWELGPEIPQMIADLESGYVEQNAPRVETAPGEKAMATFLEDMRVKGMGNPVDISLSEGDRLSVRVDNPFCEELVAGRILGYYRMLWGGPAKVEWTPGVAGFIVVSVSHS